MPRLWPLALLALTLALTGCGQSSGRLSHAVYQSRLRALVQRAEGEQADLEQALHPTAATRVSDIQTQLQAFAVADAHLGSALSALKPPADAARANAELARGEEDLSLTVRFLIPKLAELPDASAAAEFVQGSALAGSKGGREINAALQELAQLGYLER